MPAAACPSSRICDSTPEGAGGAAGPRPCRVGKTLGRCSYHTQARKDPIVAFFSFFSFLFLSFFFLIAELLRPSFSFLQGETRLKLLSRPSFFLFFAGRNPTGAALAALSFSFLFSSWF